MTTKIYRAQSRLRNTRFKPITPPRPARLERVCQLCGGVPDPGKTVCVNCEDSLLMLKIQANDGRGVMRA